jgi:SulP family sulfate permease
MPARPPSKSLLQGLRWLGPWVATVDAASLRADAGAALLAAVLVLPQAIAFATLARLPPAWGLYAAVVPTLVAALAGSSRHMLTGPTNSLALALAASLAPLAAAGSAEYLRLALVVTLMVGALQVALALLRLGELTHFISPSVLLGFTSGAALLIAWHALVELHVGPQLDAGGATAAVLAAGTLALAVLLRWRWPRAPGLLLALLAGSAAGAVAQLSFGLPVARTGALPSAWPPFAPPELAFADLPRLATIALALTLVALGQSVAVAKMLAARSGQVLDVNRECLGQGLANIAGGLCSGFVGGGSFNRSVPHLEAGARTPLAGVGAALALVLLVALARPLLAWVAMAAISGLLLAVAWTLIDRAAWRELARLDRREAAVAAGTLAATLLLPLQVAVLAGVAASLVVYLHRTAHPALRSMGFGGPPRAGATRPFVVLAPAAPECPQLKLLRMEGPVWFGAVAHVADALRALREAPQPQRHLLVMTKSMNFIDPAGAALWERERVLRDALGGGLYFHRPRPEVLALWQRSGFISRLGAEHLFADKRSAIAAIVPRLDGDICAGCRLRVFEECERQPGGTWKARAPAAPGAEWPR